MKNIIIDYIVKKISEDKDRYRNNFSKSKFDVGTRYLVIDNLLPDEIALDIHRSFPKPEEMRFVSSFREKKYTSKDFDVFNSILKDITFALQDERVVDLIEDITQLKEQQGDPSLYAGGLSAMGNGCFLRPHIDNSHDGNVELYRTLNLLFYVSPDWTISDGGNLNLWDKGVNNNVTIESKFNRLVIMETNPQSWHSVDVVVAKKQRYCVSNYYFSPQSPIGKEYFNVTSFSAEPGNIPLRTWGALDSFIRNQLRRIFPRGLAKEDIYHNPKPYE